VLGGAALAAAITPIAGPLRWVAAVVLVLLAAWTTRSALRPGPTGEAEPLEAAAPKPPADLDADGHDPAGPAMTIHGQAASTTTSSAARAPGGAASHAAGSGATATGRRVDVAGSTTPGRAYLGVLGLTLLNPATVVYFAALVLGRGGEGGGGWFVAGAFLASASWQLLIAGGGALVGRLLTGPRGRRITSLVSAVVIAVLAVALVV
jgi:arginine exporter protein ArgO